MSTLLDAALAVPTRPGPICTIANLKVTHPERAGEIDDLLAACPVRVRYSIATATLGKAFGVKFDANTVSRHCRGLCQCPR